VGCQFGSAAHKLKNEPEDQKQERGKLNDPDKDDDYQKSGYTGVRVTYKISAQYSGDGATRPHCGNA